MTAKVAQCLINFSQDKEQIKELVKLNVAGRVLDFLKENVSMNMKNTESTKATLSESEQAYVISKEFSDNYIEFFIMLLCNVTTTEEGQKHLLGEDKLKGLVLDNLFGMFCYFSKAGTFDFVSNILSNVSGLKEAREYMVEN